MHAPLWAGKAQPYHQVEKFELKVTLQQAQQRTGCTECSLHNRWLLIKTPHSCLPFRYQSPFTTRHWLFISMHPGHECNAIASWHTGQSTSLSLCLAYMWQGHNGVPDNGPLIEWLAGSGTHPRSPVTPQPRAPYGSCSASGCNPSWDEKVKAPAVKLEIRERLERSGWLRG